MRERLSGSLITVAITGAAIGAVMSGAITGAFAQAPASATASGTVLKTPWGEPDLQGIWTDETDTPMQRPAKYATQEFFTAAQRAELDLQRAALGGKDNRGQRGTELDVTGSYNDLFIVRKRTGTRTSRIADPPNGRFPPLTPEMEEINAVERDYRLALMRATETCKIGYRTCAGGTYDPTPSPRRAEPPPRFNTARMNRHDGPEDGSATDRCLTAGLPQIGGNSFRRIVQTPGGISIFYDVGQGQGWQRNVVMDGSPHLPAAIRQWYGDSRGHWEGNTLVIDVTNFSAKTDFQGARENLHLVERWTRIDATTLGYEVRIEDPTVWTKPWTVKQEFTRQSEQENKIYYEPRCNEGNYALPGLMRGARLEEVAFAEGRGPDPATKDSATAISGAEDDPLQQ
jgi:hypothetical protein